MIKTICQKAKQASYQLVALPDETIDKLLHKIAELIMTQADDILAENDKDIALARQNGIDEVMVDRLKLTAERLQAISDSVVSIANMQSPVGQTLDKWQLENGLSIEKLSVPFGVVAMIYESRPNVTVDAAVIALKSKNAIILKGGKEAIYSNRAFAKVLKQACTNFAISADAIGFIDSTDRAHAAELLTMKGYIDLLIPRGSAGLINWVTANAKVPVIETGAGNCHLFVDKSADFEMALTIIKNAKTQRPSVCNAVEKVIVHSAIAEAFIAKLIAYLSDSVKFRVHQNATHYFDNPVIMSEDEYYHEYLDYILGVIVLDDVAAAINWINQYGTHHSDGIITNDLANAKRFQTVVDSSTVYHNASTRFTDGGEFGFGAEIGIATSKLHARGPMALKEMTTYKYLVSGQGQIR